MLTPRILPTLFPYTTLFRSWYTAWDTSKANALTPEQVFMGLSAAFPAAPGAAPPQNQTPRPEDVKAMMAALDRKSTRLNSSHLVISYAVFCLKKKKKKK